MLVRFGWISDESGGNIFCLWSLWCSIKDDYRTLLGLEKIEYMDTFALSPILNPHRLIVLAGSVVPITGGLAGEGEN